MFTEPTCAPGGPAPPAPREARPRAPSGGPRPRALPWRGPRPAPSGRLRPRARGGLARSLPGLAGDLGGGSALLSVCTQDGGCPPFQSPAELPDEAEERLRDESAAGPEPRASCCLPHRLRSGLPTLQGSEGTGSGAAGLVRLL